jgi:hypothetical protein
VVNNYFVQHNMFERLNKLILHSKRYSKPRLRRLLNKLDDDMGRAMKAGEQSLRQPPQKFQYSPTLRKCGLLLQYWRTRFKDHFNESSAPFKRSKTRFVVTNRNTNYHNATKTYPSKRFARNSQRHQRYSNWLRKKQDHYDTSFRQNSWRSTETREISSACE